MLVYIIKNVFDRAHKYDSVAQLGERYLDRVEVAGSSPVGIIRRPEFWRRARVFYFSKTNGKNAHFVE